MKPRKLVLMVEGESDANAVTIVVNRLLTTMSAHGYLTVDKEPFRIGGLNKIVKDGAVEWERHLKNARKRTDAAAILCVLDGDAKKMNPSWTVYPRSAPFCPVIAARFLAEHGRMILGQNGVSLAVVFAVQEFEAWLLAGAKGLPGKRISNDLSVPAIAQAYFPDAEANRDAKGRLGAFIPGYRPALHQAAIAREIDLEEALRHSRSFRRLSSAVAELVDAVRENRNRYSPSLPVRSPAM